MTFWRFDFLAFLTMPNIHTMPRADGDFDAWQKNFVAYALAHSTALGLSHAEVEALEDAQTGWRKGLGQVTDARAYLASSVAAKNDARDAFAAIIRSAAVRIQANPEIDDAQRAALGLNAPRATGPDYPAPDSAPIVMIDAGARLVHRLRLMDSEHPTRFAKPRGVFAAAIYVALTPPGENAPADPDDYRFALTATRFPAAVEFKGADAGQTAHYLARWLNTRCQPGPWSATTSATVAG
ncbi:MAG: hypothetical protein KF841_01500 [Phycisphaerae bacterium]|nr:hypothetical protein [Phycisphaerae bacterium]